MGKWVFAWVLAGCLTSACGSGDDDDDTQVQPDAAGSADASTAIDAGLDTDAGAAVISCASYCTAVVTRCTGADAQFANEGECLAFCATTGALELGTIDDTDTNTAGCRQANAQTSSALASTQCMAAGPSGGNVCGSWCDNYCDFLLQNCTGDNEVFAERDLCLSECLYVQPSGIPGTSVGDSIQCRIFHALAAADDPVVGCAAAAPFGSEACVDQGSGDMCVDATEILGTPFFSSDTTVGLTDFGAADTCSGIADGAGSGAPDGLFEFSAIEDGVVQVLVSPSFDAAVYIADVCDDVGGSCVGGANNGGVGATEEVLFEATAGTSYFVFVDGAGSTDTGTYSISIESIAPRPSLLCGLHDQDCSASSIIGVNARAIGFDHTFVGELQSVGLGALEITDISIVAMSNLTSASVDFSTPATLESGTSAPFSLTLNPAGLGLFSADVVITSNDIAVPSLAFQVEGYAFTGAPAIRVMDGITVLIDGGSQDVGLLPIDPGTTAIAYDIVNDGDAPLTVSSIVLSDQVNVTVTGDALVPTPFTVLEGDTQRYLVEASALAGGAASFTLTINSDDPDEAAFDVSVSGSGLARVGTGGDTCAMATAVAGAPWNGNGNNADAADDLLGAGCPDVIVTPIEGGLDEVYAFTPTNTGNYQFRLNTTGPNILYIATDCADIATSCVAYHDYFEAPLFIVPLDGGTTYFVVVDGFDSTETGNYDLDVLEVTGTSSSAHSAALACWAKPLAR